MYIQCVYQCGRGRGWYKQWSVVVPVGERETPPGPEVDWHWEDAHRSRSRENDLDSQPHLGEPTYYAKRERERGEGEFYLSVDSEIETVVMCIYVKRERERVINKYIHTPFAMCLG